MEDAGTGNTISAGRNVTLAGRVKGNNNVVRIGDSLHQTSLKISVSGDNNRVEIDDPFQITGLDIRVGNHAPAHHCRLIISANFGTGRNLILLQNSGSVMTVGRDCMWSSDIVVRMGESPHLIFSKSTREYLDRPGAISIGNHVWVGEGVYMNKRVAVPDDCIIGARSVVTRRFAEANCIIAGNPAKIIRRDIEWVRNHSFLKDTPYKESFDAYTASLVDD